MCSFRNVVYTRKILETSYLRGRKLGEYSATDPTQRLATAIIGVPLNERARTVAAGSWRQMRITYGQNPLHQFPAASP